MFHGASPIIFEKAKELRKRMTLAEKYLWEKLNKGQLNGMKFRRQHPIKSFIVDFYCHSANLVIEVDGEIHFSQKDYDKGRDFELNELNLKVLRYTNEEILNDLESVIEKILVHIPK